LTLVSQKPLTKSVNYFCALMKDADFSKIFLDKPRINIIIVRVNFCTNNGNLIKN